MTPDDQNEWLDHCQDLANSHLCDTEESEDAGLLLELNLYTNVNEPF